MTNRTAPADLRASVMEIIQGVWDHETRIDDAADEAIDLVYGYRDLDKFESDAMSECMETVRADLIAAGVIGQDVPPMMVAEAVVKAVKEARQKALLDAAEAVRDSIFPKNPPEDWTEHALIRSQACNQAQLAILALIPKP